MTGSTIRQRQCHRAKLIKRALLGVALAGGALAAINAHGQTWAGYARVVDGDTIALGSVRVRLFGIDAPESAQLCRDGAGAEYRCGDRATETLRALIGSEPVHCDQRDVDRYHRIVAVCSVAGVELNRAMVSAGWAVDYTRYSHAAYKAAENVAKSKSLGIWAGEFQMPETYRREHQR